MNERYESVIKEIDRLIAIREIQEFLDNIEKKKKREKKDKSLELKKSENLRCKIVVSGNIKEEIIDLPGGNEKEIIEIFEESNKKQHKNKINWKEKFNLF